MAEPSLWSLLPVAIGGGFSGGIVVKVLDIAYQEFRKRSEGQRSASAVVDKHLDPILKSADEVVGKLRALAERDFVELIRSEAMADDAAPFDGDLANLSYLIARFWAHVEILRLESLYVALTRDRRGANLMRFLSCLESRRVRIVDRAEQRAIGETMIVPDRRPLECISYVRFVDSYRDSVRIREWLGPLVTVLRRVQHTRQRQILLRYGAVVHALIDTLDADHEVTRDRPAYPNKLTKRTRRDLQYRVFRVYLGFVASAKYWEDTKAGGQRD